MAFARVLRDTEPTLSLAGWACVVPTAVMQLAVLLDRRYKWMRFNNF